MKERTIFIIYAVLVTAGFAPFFSFFQSNPLLTIGWILGDLCSLMLLTVVVYLKGGFEDIQEPSGVQ